MNIRPLTVWRLSVLAIGIPLAYVVLFWTCPSYWHTHESREWHNLYRLQTAFSLYGYEHGEVPAGTLQDGLEALRTSAIWEDQLKLFLEGNPAVSGKDIWGRDLYYQRVSASEAVLRSFGPDGRDDAGGGDDIEFRIDIIPAETAQSQDGSQGGTGSRTGATCAKPDS